MAQIREEQEYSYRMKEEDVTDWLLRVPEEGIEKLLDNLELRTHGSRFERLDRLFSWLQGRYQAADFEDFCACGEGEARINREERRCHFLKYTCLNENASCRFEEFYGRGMPHPLTVFLHQEAHSVSQCAPEETWNEMSLQGQTHESTEHWSEHRFNPAQGQSSDWATHEELLEGRAAPHGPTESLYTGPYAMTVIAENLEKTLTAWLRPRQWHDSSESDSVDETNRSEASGNELSSAHQSESADSPPQQGSLHDASPCYHTPSGSSRIEKTQLSEDSPVQVGMAWEVGESDADIGCDAASPSGDSSGKGDLEDSPRIFKDFLQEAEKDRRYFLQEMEEDHQDSLQEVERDHKHSLQEVERDRKDVCGEEELKVETPPLAHSETSEASSCSPEGKTDESVSPANGGKAESSAYFVQKRQLRFVPRGHLKLLAARHCRPDIWWSDPSKRNEHAEMSPMIPSTKTAGRRSRARKRKKFRFSPTLRPRRA